MSCIRCGAHANFVLHPLELVACGPCCTAWLREKSCSVDAVCDALGLSEEPTRRQRGDTEKFDEELKKRTLLWAKETP